VTSFYSILFIDYLNIVNQTKIFLFSNKFPQILVFIGTNTEFMGKTIHPRKISH